MRLFLYPQRYVLPILTKPLTHCHQTQYRRGYFVFDAYVAVERGLRTEHDLPDEPGKTLELREYGAQA
jgi:hypothetical protein